MQGVGAWIKQFRSKKHFSMVEQIFQNSMTQSFARKKPKQALDMLLDKFPGSSPDYIVENRTKILEDYHVLVVEGLSLRLKTEPWSRPL